MRENIQLKTFILPYVLDSSLGGLRITLEEEIAVISCLAFCRRKKIGIISSRAEGIKAILKIYYPLVCFPRGQGCFIADGLEFLGFTFSDLIAPDMLQFIETLKRSSFVLRDFVETLNYGASLLSDLLKSGFKKHRINCLIDDASLLNLILSQSDKLVLVDAIREEKSRFVQPKLRASPLEDISGITSRLKAEVSMLKYTLKTIEDEVNNHLRMLSKESELILLEYKKKMAELEDEMDKRGKILVKKKLKEINEVEKKYNKMIRDLLREREKVEKALLRKRISLERRRKSGRRREDIYLLQMGDLEKKSKDLQKAIEKVEREKNEKIKDIEEKYEVLIKGEMEKAEVLRETRDAEMRRINEDAEKIKRMFLVTRENIMQIIGEKERLIRAIEGCSLPINICENAVIGIPFYMVVYERSGERRFDFHPPVRATGLIRATDNILKLDLESRVTSFLTPLREPVNIILNALMENCGKDPYLTSELERIMDEGNILLSRNFTDFLKCGLERLRQNRWLNSQEENIITGFYESIIKERR